MPANIYTGKNPPRAAPEPPSKPTPARPADNSWDPTKGTTGTAQDPKTVADKYGQDMFKKDVPTTKSPQSNGSPNRRPDQREPNSCGVSEEPNSFTGDVRNAVATAAWAPADRVGTRGL
ncbi:hypothetical protein [Streptodolium elevatio]|uniref:Uncharacterized protein n=1 Tax=Streptodolium elevatio TaxID=3157996 RepID=A0ABV3DWM0_9ACTN